MKTMSRLMLLAAVAALSATAQAAPKATPQTAAKAAAQPAKAKGIWIDVRTPEEFAEGHIQGAVNIPVDQIAGKIAAVSPNKNAPINLYCRSGRRAEAALQELKKMGYTQVSNHGRSGNRTAFFRLLFPPSSLKGLRIVRPALTFSGMM